MLLLKPINSSHVILASEINKEFNPDEEVNPDSFIEYIINLPRNIEIYVLCYYELIIGCGTLIIENKMIHNFSKVGHIEDIFIMPSFRGKGYGKELIKKLTRISEKKGCYKTILNCNIELIDFYKKCGYENRNVQMSKYF